MSKAISDFGDTMLTRFPPFHKWEEYQERAWADDLLAELAGFSDEVIARAKREMIRTRKPNMPRPPMVSECISACVEARRWLETAKNDGKLPMMAPDAKDEWSTERQRLAHEMKFTELGRQAAREGWIQSYWNFCRQHQRPPAGPEIERCKRESKGVEEAMAMLARIEPGPCMPAGVLTALAGLGDRMLKKSEKWAAETLAGRA